MIYLACPYTHSSPDIVKERYTKVTMVLAYLLDKGQYVFSPITHGHSAYEFMSGSTKDCPRFWLDQCYKHVINSEKVYILTLDGWKNSSGVRWEAETALAFKIPVYTIDPVTYKTELFLHSSWLA